VEKLTALTKLYVGILCFTTAWYLYQLSINGVDPALWTWLMFFAASSSSLFTYLKSGKEKTISDNVANTVDVVMTIVVSVALALHGGSFGPTKMEVVCIALSGLVLVFYFVSKKAVQSNIAINAVMAIAYIPTFLKLWAAGKNTESFVSWVLSLGCSLIACYNLWKQPIPENGKRDWLPWVYVVRGGAMTTVLLLLMSWLWFQSR
jgi:hypothetical protein